MGVQTMAASHGGGALSSTQGSVYGLTLSEVESHLGEPLRSMNLDDLLRTVLLPPAAEPRSAAGKRTVDEVWRDIQGGGGGSRRSMGEMTLEDFLSRAGVPFEGGIGAHWLPRQCPQPPPPLQYVGRPVPRPFGVGAGPALDAAYGNGHGAFLPQEAGGAGRKRGGGDGGVGEKTVERRQKRMIKNRESAARSRARKQAYTNELENKISLLEEENRRLREQKKLEPAVQFAPQPELLVQYVPQQETDQQTQLRRINSATF